MNWPDHMRMLHRLTGHERFYFKRADRDATPVLYWPTRDLFCVATGPWEFSPWMEDDELRHSMASWGAVSLVRTTP